VKVSLLLKVSLQLISVESTAVLSSSLESTEVFIVNVIFR